MPKKAFGAINFAAEFVLDTFKKVVLFAFLLVLGVLGFVTSMSILAYYIAK